MVARRGRLAGSAGIVPAPNEIIRTTSAAGEVRAGGWGATVARRERHVLRGGDIAADRLEVGLCVRADMVVSRAADLVGRLHGGEPRLVAVDRIEVWRRAGPNVVVTLGARRQG